MDLDQAVHLARTGDGYLVHYAIADVASFVAPGGALAAETWRRGSTLYSPDTNTPLHPVELSEGAASLLPGVRRPAVLWTIRLDARGEPTEVDVRRTVITSVRAVALPGSAGRCGGRHSAPFDRAVAGDRQTAARAIKGT